MAALLERKGLLRTRIEENEQELQKTNAGLDVGVRDVEVYMEEMPHDTDHASFCQRCAKRSWKHWPVELDGW